MSKVTGNLLKSAYARQCTDLQRRDASFEYARRISKRFRLCRTCVERLRATHGILRETSRNGSQPPADG